MNAAEIMIQKLETPEQKERISKFVKDYIAKLKEKSKEIKRMMSNNNYLEWLNQFTQDKDGFSDNDWLYFPEKINDFDRENVEKLSLFYEGINQYAQEKHIYPTSCDFGNFYKIRINELGYEIGILVGQGTLFFCKKVKVENEQEFIDFNDIIISKTQK